LFWHIPEQHFLEHAVQWTWLQNKRELCVQQFNIKLFLGQPVSVENSIILHRLSIWNKRTWNYWEGHVSKVLNRSLSNKISEGLGCEGEAQPRLVHPSFLPRWKEYLTYFDKANKVKPVEFA
jgi:hypothetical protein